MTKTEITAAGHRIPVFILNTAIVGTGAAGFASANRLYAYGQRDIAVITENINTGTSRNTGSDKQTYYKLTLSGGEPDSVLEMAETLFEGKCVDGDIALCEAALSAECFYRLAELGVPFPRDRYGSFIGYKTDHDPRRRATSAGPYTSKIMTEKLQQAAEKAEIPIFNHMQAIRLLTDGETLEGILCLDLKDNSFVVFRCKNAVWATGGPAGIYADVSYPIGHNGSTGVALEAGALGKNLTEWQFGLASLRPRWNVSGTYMQALPRFVSVDTDGNEREFLYDYFATEIEMLNKVFLKGYQWPFDVRKIKDGSSIIDILVYLERGKGRKVFLDFRENPGRNQVDFNALSTEAGDYLGKAGARFGTPIQRLTHMNAPAVRFYRDKKVDLSSEMLEIAVCAQHNNGGLAVDRWWQSNLEGLFVIGEAAATHGVYRPGGSALNAGQAGALRSAQYISSKRGGISPLPLSSSAIAGIESCAALAGRVCGGKENNVHALWNAAARRMSDAGGPIRDLGKIEKAVLELRSELNGFEDTVRTGGEGDLGLAFRFRDILICQLVYLEAMLNYAQNGGESRGSAFYTDKSGKALLSWLQKLPAMREAVSLGRQIQEAAYINGKTEFSWRNVREIPSDDDFFENVWRSFRENGNID